jgi:hypothetical protein
MSQAPRDTRVEHKKKQEMNMEPQRSTARTDGVYSPSFTIEVYAAWCLDGIRKRDTKNRATLSEPLRESIDGLLLAANADTHQGELVARFLLACRDPDGWGGFDPRTLWNIDAELGDAMLTILSAFAKDRLYLVALGYDEAFLELTRRWEHLRLPVAAYTNLPGATHAMTGAQYLVVQKGGSSMEVYLHAFDTREDAEADRIDCSTGDYATGSVIEVPAEIANHPAFYTIANLLLQSTVRNEILPVHA